MDRTEVEVEAGGARFFVRLFAAPGARTPPDSGSGGEGGDDLALLLHGWPQDGTAWRAVVPHLVAAGYRVACPDLKGFGRSSTPVRGYDAQTLADEISQLIRGLDARKAVLVGHDWGGAVALATAFRHPGRVRALVVASSPFRQIDLVRAWHIPLLNLPVAPVVAFRVAPGLLVRAAVRYAARVQSPFDDVTLDGYTAAVAVHPRAWLSYFRTLSRRALLDWAVRRVRRGAPFVRDPAGPHRLRVPVAVVWGERDPVTPVSLGRRVAHDLDAELVLVPGVGHFVPEEAPEAMGAAITELAGPATAASAGTPDERAG